MKFFFIFSVLTVIIGVGAFVLFTRNKDSVKEEVVPEGYHRMENGSLMRNDMGVEGMGALDELRTANQNNSVDASASLTTDPNAQVFEITGKNFSFSVPQIRVNKGDTVVVQFESTDGFHDWTLDEFNAHTDRVQPGTKTSVTFVADKAGTFEYYCSVGNHRQQGMVGKLIVEE